MSYYSTTNVELGLTVTGIDHGGRAGGRWPLQNFIWVGPYIYWAHPKMLSMTSGLFLTVVSLKLISKLWLSPNVFL